jgi:hypothetical protein
MINILGLAAVMFSALSAGNDGSEGRPIYLVTQPTAAGVKVEVVGAVTADYQATFTLEVCAAGNQSTHRSSVHLRPGGTAILSNVSVGGSPQAAWTVRLRVEPNQGPAYEQVRSSSN